MRTQSSSDTLVDAGNLIRSFYFGDFPRTRSRRLMHKYIYYSTSWKMLSELWTDPQNPDGWSSLPFLEELKKLWRNLSQTKLHISITGEALEPHDTRAPGQLKQNLCRWVLSTHKFKICSGHYNMHLVLRTSAFKRNGKLTS